jgi:hypothetical protein
MKRIIFSAVGLLALAQPVFASANVDCVAKDKNVESLVIEAITSRDGKFLATLRGELALEPGKAIELSKSDVKTHYLQKNISLTLVKRTPQGVLEIRIYAKPVSNDELDYEGGYVVRLGKINKSGKVACTAG